MGMSTNISRRDFIKAGLAAGLAPILSGGCGNPASTAIAQEQSPRRWALLSDLHISEDAGDNYRGCYPNKNLQAIVPQVVSLAPDAVAITGDLARLTGKTGDYQNLKKILVPISENTPVFFSLGNHDHRERFLQTFDNLPGKPQPVADKVVVEAETLPVRILMLDSLLFTDKVPGFLGPKQRQWLADYLRRADTTPTILCLHHMYGEGKINLMDMPWLYEIIVPMTKVKAVVYGHSHAYGFSEYSGIHLINLPATGYNFNDQDPVGWVDARWTATGGEFTLHAIAGNRDKDGTVTKLAWRS
jgi:Icc protein